MMCIMDEESEKWGDGGTELGAEVERRELPCICIVFVWYLYGICMEGAPTLRCHAGCEECPHLRYFLHFLHFDILIF